MRAAWCIAVAIVCVVVLVGCTSSVPASSDNVLRNRLVADNNGGNRAFPGPGYDPSVDYVAGILRNAG